MGRDSKFSDSLAQIMLELYEKGYTDKQVAKFVGISERAINYWKGNNKSFLQSLRNSKGVADDLVEASLFNRAIGYTSKETKVFNYYGKIIKTEIDRYYPPDVTAQIFWLKNRRPDTWRDIKEPYENENNSQVKKIEKVSFTDFCLKAKYPAPFPKQIEMWEFGFTLDMPRLLLGSRGYGKSDYLTVLGLAYSIYCNYIDNLNEGNPLDESNLIISKSKSRNTAMIEEIAKALIENGVQLEKQNSTCIRVKGTIGKDHSVEALTIKTSFRGRHPKRIIMDDPVTEEDVSDAMRILVKRKYDEAYKLCKNILVIGQPAHAFDLYAELRGILNKLEIPWGSIPELDVDLEAMRLAGVDQNSIEMSYHLRIPQDGSSIFSNLKYLDSMPEGDTVAFIDPSDGGDYTAISIIKGHFDGVAVFGKAYKKAWYHCLDDLVPVLLAKRVRKLCFETNKHGTQPIEQLQILLAPHGIGVVGKFSDTNKHAVIQSAGSYAHMIHLSKDSDKVYTDQVVKYEYNAKHDDAPDSLARCLEWIGLIRGKK